MTKFDWLQLSANIVEGVTGIVGASLILTENHPYFTLGALSLGMVATKVIAFLKEKHRV